MPWLTVSRGQATSAWSERRSRLRAGGSLGICDLRQLSVREFDVLITLFNAPDHRLRMTELAQRMMLSPSGLTRLVEQLERERLVERQKDSTDTRRFRAVLTRQGLQRLDAARTTHNVVIRRHFTDRLSSEELRELGVLWEKVLPDGQ
jgi:DNA-binding MarR family transcriptional regulator